ncbi:MAG: helix-turn-helix domain-containing protein [Planctomycetota bacterium]|jgi:DNA-binding transcriptional regulator YiaG
MGKVEDALRDFIQYHSKRAAGELLGDTPAELRRTQREIRALRRVVEKLAADVKALVEARQREMPVPPAPEEQTAEVRFTRRTLPSLRRRLGLTQQELSRLLQVSPVTVTAWESGRSRPRKANLAQIVTLRKMDRAQIDRALQRESVPAPVRPQQLRRIRRKFSLTQANLAALLGVSAASVTSWEAGKTTPGRESRRLIAGLRELSPRQVRERLGGRGPARPRALGRRAPRLSPRRVQAIRREAGLSQREMAKRLGVSVNSVSNWETGRSTPRGRNAQKILSLSLQK